MQRSREEEKRGKKKKGGMAIVVVQLSLWILKKQQYNVNTWIRKYARQDCSLRCREGGGKRNFQVTERKR
jgi:hypothetical protein